MTATPIRAEELDSFADRCIARALKRSDAAAFLAECSQVEKQYVLSKINNGQSASSATRLLSAKGNANLDNRQRAFISTFVDRYAKRTARSKASAQKYRPHFADQRTPPNFNPLIKEVHYPLTYESAKGAYVTDIDGNRYIDIAADYGVNLFGHAPEFLAQALREQISQGMALSGRYSAIGESAAAFCRITGKERVAFCQSGTESVISAVRLARARTGRERIAMFEGAYHGHSDAFQHYQMPGVDRAVSETTVMLRYGDLASIERIRTLADTLAAVVVEPVQSAQIELQPAEFLRALRDATRELGIVLIFDEMISSFRVHPRGCEAIFDVEADLTTYGKILGGGLAAGAVAGRADILKWADGGDWHYGDDSKPGPTAFIAGTHTQNPLKMAATLAVLSEIERRSPQLQETLTARTDKLASQINRYAEGNGLPFKVSSFGSQFRFAFQTPRYTITEALFLHLLNEAGVRYNLHGNCFLTCAHTDQDVQEVVQAVTRVLATLKEKGFFYEAEVDPHPTDSLASAGTSSDQSATKHSPDPAPAASVTTPTDAPIQVVHKVVSKVLEIDADDLDVDDDLGVLGVTSIINMEIVGRLAEAFCIELQPNEVADARSIRTLAEAIAEAHPVQNGDDYSAAPVATPASAAERSPKRSRVERVAQIARLRDQGSNFQDVAVVGLSARLPGAPNARSLWESLDAGRSHFSEIPADRWNWHRYWSGDDSPGSTRSKWGAFLTDHDMFDPLFFHISPREARWMDPQCRLVLQQVYHAVEDAGINIDHLAGSLAGVFVGYEYEDYERYLREFSTANPDQSGMPGQSNAAYYLANRVSYAFDLKGPSEAINVNCASSAVSINRACQSLLSGECDLAFAGGVNLQLRADNYLQSGALLSPDGSCRVLEQEANGFTKGEGCAVVVLKRADDARRDGDHLYGVIKTCQQINRGHAKSLSEVQAEAVAQVIGAAQSRSPGPIHYVEVDGYCTPESDGAEIAGVEKALRENASAGKTAVGSLKVNVGNLEPVNGVAALVKACLSMFHRTIPPSACLSGGDPLEAVASSDVVYAATEHRPFSDLPENESVRIGINSFADSGVLVHMIVEAPEDNTEREQASESVQVFVLSAHSAKSYRRMLADWQEFLDTDEANATSFPGLCRTLQRRRSMKYRFACVATDFGEVREAIAHALDAEPVLTKAQGAGDDNNSMPQDAQSLAERWLSGLDVAWEQMQTTSTCTIPQLPCYPFASKRYWVE